MRNITKRYGEYIMKKCTFCGNNNFDTDKVCDRCNFPLPTTEPYIAPHPTFNQPRAYYPNAYIARRPSGLTVATEVIMIINTVLYVTTTFKVCSLIFLNVLTGVLMLCNNEV